MVRNISISTIVTHWDKVGSSTPVNGPQSNSQSWVHQYIFLTEMLRSKQQPMSSGARRLSSGHHQLGQSS